MVTGVRLFFLFSIGMWLIRFFTNNDVRRYCQSNINENCSENDTCGKETDNIVNLNENIEMAKKFVTSKKESDTFNLENIVTAIIFLVVTFTITFLLYFLKQDSCNELINSFK